jgi:hypothetical protein
MSGLVRARYELPSIPIAEPQLTIVPLPSLIARKLFAFYGRGYTSEEPSAYKFDCISFSNYTTDLIPEPCYTGQFSPRAYSEVRSARPTDLDPGSAYLMMDGGREIHSFFAVSPRKGVALLGVNQPLVLGTVEQLQAVYPTDKLYQQVKSSQSLSYPVQEIG